MSQPIGTESIASADVGHFGIVSSEPRAIKLARFMWLPEAGKAT